MATVEFKVPELGEGVYEAEFIAWHVQPGASVRRGQPLMEVMTDKATMEVPAPFAGTVAELRAKPGQKIQVGDTVLTYQPASQADGAMAEPQIAATTTSRTVSGSQPPKQRSSAKRGNGAAPLGHRDGAVKAAPSVRLLARKMGIDLSQLHGTGPHGRILIDDLSAATVARPPEREEVRVDCGTPGSRIPLIGLRRCIAERMVESKHTIPHYSYVDECDVTALVELRDSLREQFSQAGIKLTYLPFIVKAVARALKEVPLVNASLDEATQEIVLHDRYHIGVAVATPGGLIVPVVHDADEKDIPQIARDIDRLSADARAGKARLEDLRDGTFTVTSIGSIGGLISTPIINPPEVGILGVGKVVQRPVFDAAGQVRPAHMVYLSFSFDHRVFDGAIGAAFGNAVIRRLRQPAGLLLPERLP